MSFPTQNPIHHYATPYGRWRVKETSNGVWNIAFCFDTNDRAFIGSVSEKLFTRLERITDRNPLHGLRVVSEERSCLLRLSSEGGLRMLSERKEPLTTGMVKKLAENLLYQLSLLHGVGIVVSDFSPQQVFCSEMMSQCCIVPSPWIWKAAPFFPGRTAEMPYVAGDYDRVGEVSRNRGLVQADIFGYGALLWRLVTGSDRKDSPRMLPSELDSRAATWDTLLDACCRTHAPRRCQTLNEILKLLQTVK